MDWHRLARADPASAVLGHGIRFTQIRSFLGGGLGEMEDGLGNKPA